MSISVYWLLGLEGLYQIVAELYTEIAICHARREAKVENKR
jgi:hypothetical protein